MNCKLLFGILLLVSCHNQRQPKSTFVRDIPAYLLDSNYQIRMQNGTYNLIGLNTLENGSDSFGLRITLGFGIVAGLDIFSIRKDSLGWVGRHFFFMKDKFEETYRGAERYQGYNTEVDSMWLAKPITPICGWGKFADSIRYYDLYSIRDMYEMSECKLGGADGTTAIVELATSNSYKYVHHWISGESTCEEFVRFKNFIAMLERQFGPDFCWPRRWVTWPDKQKNDH